MRPRASPNLTKVENGLCALGTDLPPCHRHTPMGEGLASVSTFYAVDGCPPAKPKNGPKAQASANRILRPISSHHPPAPPSQSPHLLVEKHGQHELVGLLRQVGEEQDVIWWVFRKLQGRDKSP